MFPATNGRFPNLGEICFDPRLSCWFSKHYQYSQNRGKINNVPLSAAFSAL